MQCMRSIEPLPLVDVPMYFVRDNLFYLLACRTCPEITQSMFFVRDATVYFSRRAQGKLILMAPTSEQPSHTCI